MKTIIITEVQKKILKEAMQREELLHNLPYHLIEDIKMENTSVSIIDYFSTKEGKKYLQDLLIDKFNRIKNSFNDDISTITKDDINNKLNYLLNKCYKKEEPFRKQLEKICFNILNEIFILPENSFSYECHIIKDVQHNENFNVYPTPDIDSVTVNNEAQKRRLVNVLCVGASDILFDSSIQLIKKHIQSLDKELPDLYKRIMLINDLALFYNKIDITDKDNKQMGYCKVTLGNDEELVKIEVYANNFAILLYESIKAFMQIFGSFSLTNSHGENKKIMDISDALSFEPWDMRIGDMLFNDIFLNGRDIKSEDIPYIFREFSEQDENILTIFNNSNKDYIINSIISTALKKHDYEDFECDIIDKQNDTSLITDDINEIESETDNYYGWS